MLRLQRVDWPSSGRSRRCGWSRRSFREPWRRSRGATNRIQGPNRHALASQPWAYLGRILPWWCSRRSAPRGETRPPRSSPSTSSTSRTRARLQAGRRRVGPGPHEPSRRRRRHGQSPRSGIVSIAIGTRRRRIRDDSSSSATGATTRAAPTHPPEHSGPKGPAPPGFGPGGAVLRLQRVDRPSSGRSRRCAWSPRSFRGPWPRSCGATNGIRGPNGHALASQSRAYLGRIPSLLSQGRTSDGSPPLAGAYLGRILRSTGCPPPSERR